MLTDIDVENTLNFGKRSYISEIIVLYYYFLLCLLISVCSLHLNALGFLSKNIFYVKNMTYAYFKMSYFCNTCV